MKLILASTSPYRRSLLQRLGLPFTCVSPQVDETPLAGENPPALAARLAQAKAGAVAGRFPEALVIGSDQVAELDGRALGKPGAFEAAAEQLQASSGRQVLFHTGVALQCVARDLSLLHVEPLAIEVGLGLVKLVDANASSPTKVTSSLYISGMDLLVSTNV